VTGFSKQVREQVVNRALQRCERCGMSSVAFQWHHRRPRGAGGSKAPDTNLASNCVLLCVPCHQSVESNRDDALHEGFLVLQGHRPAEVPVWISWRWVYLKDDGTVEER
jgi:hypothetical protein